MTAQRRNSATLLREKPSPAYRRTLPQQYQRWLYEDYAYLWRQQSLATRQEYAAAGSRYHLTGFQYWMKYHLANLPDIGGMWRLDEKAGAIAYDSSRNANHGVITGATPADGLIDGARYFDGLNDKINCGMAPSVSPSIGDFTIECFFYTKDITKNQIFIGKEFVIARQWRLDLWSKKFRFLATDSGGSVFAQADDFAINDTWYHICGRRTGVLLELLISASLQIITANLPGDSDVNPPTGPFMVGEYMGGTNTHGYTDHITLWHRALDNTEILRHSKRRFPA